MLNGLTQQSQEWAGVPETCELKIFLNFQKIMSLQINLQILLTFLKT